MPKTEIRMKSAIEPLTFVYDVAVQLQPGAPAALYEPLQPADLIDINSEIWLESHLRKGRPDLRLEDLCTRLLPALAEGSDSRCDGLIVESRIPGGGADYHRISIQTLSPVAERGAGRLIKDGLLEAGQPYFYEVIARRIPDPAPPAVFADGLPAAKTTLKHKPLSYHEVHLPALLQRAETVGAVDGWMPVIYTRRTFENAEQFARTGAADHPPVETGAVILGLLCACPATGEFFVVATDAIALADTRQSGFSLTYTGKTWAGIQTVLKARQANPATRGTRMIGQCHGHNFLPQTGTNRCDGCTRRKACGLTSVFVSESDLLWSRSVFARQPWAFCHIFGLDVCASPVHGLFGFRQGRLVERGFYLIDDFSINAVRTEEARRDDRQKNKTPPHADNAVK